MSDTRAYIISGRHDQSQHDSARTDKKEEQGLVSILPRAKDNKDTGTTNNSNEREYRVPGEGASQRANKKRTIASSAFTKEKRVKTASVGAPKLTNKEIDCEDGPWQALQLETKTRKREPHEKSLKAFASYTRKCFALWWKWHHTPGSQKSDDLFCNYREWVLGRIDFDGQGRLIAQGVPESYGVGESRQMFQVWLKKLAAK